METLTVYYDGLCNLCQASVQFILKHDKQARFRFASLQGEAGRKISTNAQLNAGDLSTFILAEGDRVYTRSTGGLRVLKHLGGAWTICYGLIIIPRFIRDAVYTYISKNRYKWFGKKETCWLPDNKWAGRFLD